ncbi:helix-turn-helix domain-containing protein [Denitrobaculum tricleocarpae]|uniref:Helix-turn-helix domain-containing protein n=1 Tax=Denitrobaculum tricleocarpae TaxID=2591009 RepID=A0A545TEQ6_9PROT|nr:helix-turn-helix transcriptional regulator [Denitrobaculum tricleocarpae]TQV75692.1 helix-turn-helix domain-containing protein [Denitrobaculum tricleocarpae]
MARAPIGLKLRERRKTLGVTQTALAAKVGVSPSYLNLIESEKRNIGGSLLIRIADELDIRMEELDGAADRRLIDDLGEIAASPTFQNLKVSPQSAGELVGRHPDWARALTVLYRTYMDRDQTVIALADRLNQDPFLSAAVHRMLTNVASIRSASEILESVSDIEPDQRERFHNILLTESDQLSSVAEGLAAFFDKGVAPTRSISPNEEIDDFLQEHQNHFPELETAAEALASSLHLKEQGITIALSEMIERRYGLSITYAAPESKWESKRVSKPGSKSGPHPLETNGATQDKRMVLAEALPGPTRRFLLARTAAELALTEPISAIIEKSSTLTSAEARRRATGALASYCASAMLLPYDRFLEQAVKLRYDIERLRHSFDVSLEQVCHRLVTLRKPGNEGIPFAFMRVDPSGYVSKRYALPGLPIPRYGGACPLWPVYRAFQTPGMVNCSLAAFPNNDRFLFVACAVEKGASAYGQHRPLLSIMLACEALYADQTVYGDTLSTATRDQALAVGPTCRLCTREDCAHRQEDLIVAT